MKYDINDIDETTKLYFDSLKDVKPLSKKEEHELLSRYKKNHDLSARNKVIKSNLRYACKLASSYRNRGLSFSDLISEANSGLLESIERFDLSKDVKLISYSKWWIMQRMQSAIDGKNKIQISELPEEKEKETPVSIDDELAMETEKPTCEDAFIIDTEVEENKEEIYDFIEKLMSCLSERETEMINMRFGRGCDIKTLDEIGKKYKLSKERARQIIDGALTKLRSQSMMTNNKYLYD